MRLFVFLLLFSTPGWAQNCPPIDPEKQKEEEKTCSASGGQWGRFGVFAHLCGIYTCAPRTKDGGKPCRGRADCEYQCVSRRELPLGTEVTGECAAVVTEFGCTIQVESGRIAGRVCVE